MGKYYNTKPNNRSSFTIILIKKNKCELLVQSKPKPQSIWSTWHLCSLLLALLPNEGFVDMGNDTWKKQNKTKIKKKKKKYSWDQEFHAKVAVICRKIFLPHAQYRFKTAHLSQGMKLNSPPPAIVALIRESNSSSPRMASCKWRGVIRFTFKSLEALPANSSTW